MSIPAPSLVKVKLPPVSLAAVPHEERVLASAAYFSSFAGLWLIVPAAIYLWKGRQSRFLGFHAVQSVLLQVALIPVGCFGLGVAFAIMEAIEIFGSARAAPLASLLFFIVLGVTVTLPSATIVWLGFSALRGKPRALPLLGRWANQIVRDV